MIHHEPRIPSRRKNICSVGMLMISLLMTTICLSDALAVRIGGVVIENRGETPIDEDAVRIHLEARPGMEFSQSLINRDVRNLHGTGLYSDVEAEIEPLSDSVVVTYGLTRRPVLARIVVEGADRFGNSKVREEMDIDIGDPVDDHVLGNAAFRVKRAYRKDFFIEPSLSWTIDKDPANRATVRVTVEEGPRMKVGRIKFTGNEHFTDRELRRAMDLRAFRWYNLWHWISGAGRLEPGKLLQDGMELRSLYRDEGFLDVEIGEPELRPISDKRLAVVVPIEENSKYRLGDVHLEGITLFEEQDVRTAVGMSRGEVAGQSAIDWDARMVQEYFGSRGYINTRVHPRIIVRDEDMVDVHYVVREGTLGSIRDIIITGNRVTRDEVIRRELATLPGEVYNERRVRTSEARLRNLGYFDRVISYYEETERSGLYDLIYRVDERQMGRMSVGASFSSIDKLVGFFEIAHGNFDLSSWPPIGAGQKINFRAELGRERRDFSISFTEPWFLNRRLALGLDLYSRESRFLSGDYDQKNRGASVSLTQPLGVFNRLRTAYSIENYKIYNVAEDASQRIKDEKGDWVKSSVLASITRDTRDQFLVPTSGTRTRLTGTVSGGPMQGDIDIFSLELMASQHWNPWFDHVISFRERVGVVDSYGSSDRVPIFDRFFLGGPFSLRGFNYRRVGPVDEEREPIGGRSMAFASAEYTVPVVEAVRLAAFYDVGMVWEDAWQFNSDINSNYGFGVRFDIPMFPIRLDYAWPLETSEHNDRDSGRFSFAIGHFF